MITGIVKGRVNDVYTKDWEMDGKKGVSYIVNVYQGQGDNEEVKVSESLFPYYKDMIGKEIELECKLFLAKGSRYNLKAVEEVS